MPIKPSKIGDPKRRAVITVSAVIATFSWFLGYYAYYLPLWHSVRSMPLEGGEPSSGGVLLQAFFRVIITQSGDTGVVGWQKPRWALGNLGIDKTVGSPQTFVSAF